MSSASFFALARSSFYVFIFNTCFLLTSQAEISVDVKNVRCSKPEARYQFEFDIPPKPGWIDPFDMTGETTHDRPRFKSDSLFVQSDIDNEMCKNRVEKYMTYMKRFVNMFLRSAGLKDATDSGHTSRPVKMEFVIAEKDLKVLQQFGKSNYPEESIEGISRVFDNIFKQPNFSRKEKNSGISLNMLLKWVTDTVSAVLKSPEWFITSFVSLMLMTLFWFAFKTHSYRLSIFTLLLMVFLSDFGITWMRKYEEEGIKAYYSQLKHSGNPGNLPYHCSGKQLWWYEHIYYRMYGEDCEQVWFMRDTRPVLKVSLTKVFADVFSSMFFRPLGNIGTAYGGFIDSSMRTTPWFLKPIVMPIVIFVPLAFTTILLAFIFNYRISLSLTGFHLLPSWSGSVGHKQNDKFVEDISHKKENTNSHVLNDDKNPLIYLNIPALKKLMKHSKKDNDSDSEVNDSDKEDHRNNESSSVNIENKTKKVSSKLLSLPDNCKRRKRSIHTLGEGFNRSDTLDLSDLASGDHTESDKSEDTEVLANKLR